MQFPFILVLQQRVVDTFKRFPLECLLAIVSTVMACRLVKNAHQMDAFSLQLQFKFLIVSNLTFNLLLSADLFSESIEGLNVIKFRQQLVSLKSILRLLSLGLGVFFFFSLDPLHHPTDYLRIALLAFAFHLLVAFAPFIIKNKQHDRSYQLAAFWYYNKSLFLQFQTMASYAAVLFAGLSGALAAIGFLFNISIASGIYFQLFCLIAIGFNTIAFLAAVPQQVSVTTLTECYPKGLKIWAQYILVPLATIYLCILLGYEFKLLIDRQLPQNLICYLVLAYAVLGILSLLLVYPIRNNAENKWVQLYARFFYITLIPLILLMGLAIWKRVDAYGITEVRYVLILLALWIAFITLYFLWSKKQSIKIIPTSLFLLALLGVYGPFSASAISKLSQMDRFKKLRSIHTEAAMGEQMEAIKYLVEYYGLSSVQTFTAENLTIREKNIDNKLNMGYDEKLNEKIKIAAKLLKIQADEIKEYKNGATIDYSIKLKNGAGINIGQFDYMVSFNDEGIQPEPTEGGILFDGKKIKLSIEKDSSLPVTVTLGSDQPVRFDLRRLWDRVHRSVNQNRTTGEEMWYPYEQMRLEAENDLYRFELVVRKLKGQYQSKSERFSNSLYIEGFVFIKRKKTA